MDAEVRPYAPGAYIDPKATKIGYELSFTKYFTSLCSFAPCRR